MGGLNLTYGYTVDGERLLTGSGPDIPDSYSITIRDLDGKVIRELFYDGESYSWVKDDIHANGKILATGVEIGPGPFGPEAGCVRDIREMDTSIQWVEIGAGPFDPAA